MAKKPTKQDLIDALVAQRVDLQGGDASRRVACPVLDHTALVVVTTGRSRASSPAISQGASKPPILFMNDSRHGRIELAHRALGLARAHAA